MSVISALSDLPRKRTCRRDGVRHPVIGSSPVGGARATRRLASHARNGFKAEKHQRLAGLTLLIPPPYFAGVTRLFIAVLCAFGLALSPMVTEAAVAAPSGMPGCTMDQQQMPAKPADHSKMDCCTPACQIAAAAALLPERNSADILQKADGALHERNAVKELASFTASGLDPPPRLPS